MNNPNEFDFGSHEIVKVSVTGPNKKQYNLVEASADATAKYKSAQARCARFKDGEMHGVDGVGDLEPYLVSMCLFPINDKGEQATTSENFSVIRGWPSPIVAKLYDKAREISEIDRDDDIKSLLKQRANLDKLIVKLQGEDPAKNELSSTKEPSVSVTN